MNLRSKIILKSFIISLAILLLLVNVYAAPVTITNGTQFLDTNSNIIHAHGGGVIKVGSYYYWFGENRNPDDTFYAVSCYRSTDLKTWEFRNNVLTQSSNSDLASAKIERPKVIYCSSTGQYVMWMHKENATDYNQARAAVAYCSTVDGNYTYVSSFQPLNYMSRDCTLFTDSDGSAYFISSSNNNADLHVYKLSSDYKSIANLVQKLFVGSSREAPCMFKQNSYYYLITSGCTGWSPNQQMYSYATSISGTWSALTNIGDSTCYNSQGAYVLPVQGSSGTSYLFMGDRWAGAWGGKANDSSYVWLPITFNSNTSLTMNWYNSITIDTSTGTISSPTNLALNKTASADSSQSGNGASNGNDGSTSTRWCATDGNTGHWWKVDLGSSVNITSTQVMWEYSAAYKYKIDVSTDNSTWTTKVDKSGNTTAAQTMADTFSATARYLRITVTGLPSGDWASFYEFSVYGSTGPAPTPTPSPTPTPGANLVGNPGFETGSLSPWYAWNDAAVSSTGARTGSYCLRVGNGQASSEQVITVQPNTTYILSGYAFAPSGQEVRIGVKNYGGTETAASITNTSYTQGSVTFTTGSSNTTATIYLYHPSGTGNCYGDDFSVIKQ